MGDAGGQLAQGGHLLGLDQPVLGAMQVGQRGLGSGARAARFLAPPAEFLKQPRVLDGEHGLPGEGLQQGRDGRREASFAAPADHQATDDFFVAQQRHREYGVNAGQSSGCVWHGGVLLYVLDVDGRAQQRAAAEMGFA